MAVTTVIWLKNDLRLHDNEVFHQALKTSDFILPVFCIDPRSFVRHPDGIFKMGVFRKKFLKESLESLAGELNERGSKLIVRVGHPERVLPQLIDEIQAEQLFTSQELAPEELRIMNGVQDALASMKIRFQVFDTASLFQAEQLPRTPDQIPDVFTDYRKLVEKCCEVYQPWPTPTHINFPRHTLLSDNWSVWLDTPHRYSDPRSAFPFQGGEQKAFQRIHNYFHKSRRLDTYKQTRNQLIGPDYSSKFSSWLANGSLSVRHIYHEIKQYEKVYGSNESTYWLFFELLWRDFFRCMFRKYPNSYFKMNGIRNQAPNSSTNDLDAFHRWCQGTTGHDFIDANMRELNTTGFMSNRGRQVVASYLCHNLGVDWRWGARYFEQQLIDYDVCSNWCNWAYVAGVGNDPRQGRYFNPDKQAEEYDTLRTYRQLWLC